MGQSGSLGLEAGYYNHDAVRDLAQPLSCVRLTSKPSAAVHTCLILLGRRGLPAQEFRATQVPVGPYVKKQPVFIFLLQRLTSFLFVVCDEVLLCGQAGLELVLVQPPKCREYSGITLRCLLVPHQNLERAR